MLLIFLEICVSANGSLDCPTNRDKSVAARQDAVLKPIPRSKSMVWVENRTTRCQGTWAVEETFIAMKTFTCQHRQEIPFDTLVVEYRSETRVRGCGGG